MLKVRLKMWCSEKLCRFPLVRLVARSGYHFICSVFFVLKLQMLKMGVIQNLNRFEYRCYSQNGEDGILQGIFAKIDMQSRFFVEFGVGDSSECNTRLLWKMGWKGLWMDAGTHSQLVHNEFITAENINQLFEKYNVPERFDLLSIDIDGNDYWVWKNLEGKYSPRVVVVEYNAKYDPSESRVIPYDPNYVADGTDFFGASLLAFVRLAQIKGYSLVACDSMGVNAFFVKNEEAKKFATNDIAKLYRPHRYVLAENNYAHPPSGKEMMCV